MVNGDDTGGELVEVWNGGVRSSTSLVQTEVVPGIVGIGGRPSCITVSHIGGPLSPSKTVVPGVALGGTVCTWTARGEGVAGNGDGVG